MKQTILTHATVITVNEQNEVIHDGAVAFAGSTITYVGPTPEDVSGYDEVIDLKGNYVLPGLINTHGHAGMSLLRGYSDDLPLQQWLEDKMWPLEAQFTGDHVKWGTYLSLIEMIRTGTTTFVDMYDHMDEVAKAVEATGMRARLCRGMIGLCSEEERAAKLEEATDFAKNWHNQADGRITTMLAPHAPYTCPPEFIMQIVERAEELALPIHIHMSETKWEVGQNEQDYGLRPVAHLEKLGVFRRPTLVAHAVHLTDEEIDVLANYQVKVSHNVVSNLKLASGVAPVPKMLAKGISVSLGTDSTASNNNLNLFEELKLAAILHKGVSYDPVAVPAEEALRMATRYGADGVFQPDALGSIETGKQADLIVLDSHQAHFHPAHNPVSHVVYAANGRDVTDTIVAGRFLMRNRELLTVDEERVIFEANRVFQTLKR
ncbi:MULTISPECIES: amidohydrolase [Brevibacillus]|jgi:5-methylthioadenosine/S-adenosylhomocysteine deaminase|uniref:5-methylthioadenosine/S-adenosylhomocysteine deaminase n=1 Tax=Brevibacillus aydinogluensis TaxID=927786 RepID=A0AA48M7Q0_9BACL|nr:MULTISPECIES: amidohydrolase [Bacillales]MDT3415419.1 5-methylthioadenosine/S-adenosylhomocysteine deaminase [Brevibacillus aydinogluensis]UFJ60501.1 amidohydrolase [Anoxybacillus sediminis]CAJ1002799.1 5-methylthioadenosine/S-adenosylhomocysteine deaminase [Brevibacillus aydinogluensis]